MQKIYTVKDLQTILKIGKNTAYELMRAKGFPSYKLNGRFFVTDEALSSWLSNIQGRTFNI